MCAVDAGGQKQVLHLRGRTREDVQRELAQIVADRQRGLPLDPGRMTLGEFLARWLDTAVKPSTRPSTFASYALNVRLHLGPSLGHIALRKLAPADVQGFYARKLEGGLSPRTVQYLHSILHRSLEQAVRWGLAPRNVCDAVDRPKAPRKLMTTLTPAEAARFLDAARADRFYALYVLAVTCGLRQGELLGLTWAQVNFKEEQLAVSSQLQFRRGTDGEAGRFELVQTKGGRGRNVALPPLAVSSLQQHRRAQLQERLALGEAWDGAWDLVFVTQVGTPVHHGNLLRRSFFPLLAKAGCPRIRFHDLRHTCATLLLQAGEHPKVVQELLGHASVTLTLDVYSHVLPSMQKAAAARIQAVLEAAKPGR